MQKVAQRASNILKKFTKCLVQNLITTFSKAKRRRAVGSLYMRTKIFSKKVTARLYIKVSKTDCIRAFLSRHVVRRRTKPRTSVCWSSSKNREHSIHPLR